MEQTRRVTLQDVLENNEARAARQQAIIQQYPGALISFTLVMPGPKKDTPLSRRIFEVGWKELLRRVSRSGWIILTSRILYLPTGPEALLVVDAPPLEVKQAMALIEEEHTLGRLFDLDVLDQTLRPISRTAVALAPRGCLICGQPAAVCRRQRKHSTEELLSAVRARYHAWHNGLSGEPDLEKDLKVQSLASAPAANPPLPKGRKPETGTLLHSLLVFVAAIAALYLAAAGLIVRAGWSDEIFPADLLVVLGNEVYADGTPSPRLAARLDKAIELFPQGVAPQIIVSGGEGKSGSSEAVAMAGYLKARGVPEEALVLDSSGVNTWATALFTKEYMRTHGLNRVIAVSQYFHLPRTRASLEALRVGRVGTATAQYVEQRDWFSITREVPALAFYMLCHTGIAAGLAALF